MSSESESSLEIDQPRARVTRSKKRTKEKRTPPGNGSSPSAVNGVPSGQSRSQVIAAAKQVHRGSPSFTSFYLFFAGTFLLAVSCTLLSSGVWSLLVRLPMIHLVHDPARILLQLAYYTVATGLITFPASRILYREHNVTERGRPLLPVIALLSICTIFLTCCAGHAIVYRKSAYSHLEDSVISSASISPNSVPVLASASPSRD